MELTGFLIVVGVSVLIGGAVVILLSKNNSNSIIKARQALINVYNWIKSKFKKN